LQLVTLSSCHFAEGLMGETHSFGYWVRRRRKALDLTQAELARLVGCAEVTIRRIEADERRPSRQAAALLAEQLQVSADERLTFLKAARAELAADRLAVDSQPIAAQTAAVARAQISLGHLAWREGDEQRADRLFKESLSLYRPLDDRVGTACARYWAASLAVRQGDIASATALLEESPTLFEQSQSDESRVIGLVGLVAVAAASEQLERAARLCGAVELIITDESVDPTAAYGSGAPWSIYRAEYDRAVTAIRAQLDEDAFAAAWAAGRR
jgi:transcriptional regulator with XRE-family HTH domain